MRNTLEKRIDNLSKVVVDGFKRSEKRFNDLEKGLNDLAIATKKGFDEVHRKFEDVDRRFAEVNSRLDNLQMHSMGHSSRLDIVEDKIRIINTRLGLN